MHCIAIYRYLLLTYFLTYVTPPCTTEKQNLEKIDEENDDESHPDGEGEYHQHEGEVHIEDDDSHNTPVMGWFS
jgi:hypothetical protein